MEQLGARRQVQQLALKRSSFLLDFTGIAQTAHEALRRDYLRYFAQQTTGGLVGAVLASAKVPQAASPPQVLQHLAEVARSFMRPVAEVPMGNVPKPERWRSRCGLPPAKT